MCNCKCGVEIKQLNLSEEECIAIIKAAFGNKMTSELVTIN